MADDSLDNLAIGGSLGGDPLSLSPSLGSGSSGLSSSGLFGAGALGLGALGFGALLAQGPGSLPSQYGQLTASVPTLQAQGGQAFSEGQTLIGQGSQALEMAQHGQLTPQQQAQVDVYGQGLTNQARQMYASMGIDPGKDTSFISTTADIDAKVNAMAQSQIQSTIQLGLGEISGGTSLTGQALGYENAANQALLQAGEAQLKQDQQYSSSLTSAFGAIGSLFGSVGKALFAL